MSLYPRQAPLTADLVLAKAGGSRITTSHERPPPAVSGLRYPLLIPLRTQLAFLQPFYLIAQILEGIVHYKLHAILESVQFHILFGAFNGMLRYVKAGHFLGAIKAGMQRETARMRKAFQHCGSIPIRKSNFLSAFVHR